MEMLKEHKVDIHSPSKDQCDTCVSFNLSALPKEQCDEHFIKINEARTFAVHLRRIQWRHNFASCITSYIRDQPATVYIIFNNFLYLFYVKCLSTSVFIQFVLLCRNFNHYTSSNLTNYLSICFSTKQTDQMTQQAQQLTKQAHILRPSTVDTCYLQYSHTHSHTQLHTACINRRSRF